MPRPVSDSYKGPSDDAPYVPSWCYPNGPRVCPCGHHARPMHPQWVRDLRDACEKNCIPFLFKQWGEWTPGENVGDHPTLVGAHVRFDDGSYAIEKFSPCILDELHRDDEPDVWRVGKHAAGRLLDGMEHNRFPKEIAR